MPVKPSGSETEQEFISRCMGDEKDSFPDNAQRYAVCKSYYDKDKMSKIKDTMAKVYARVAYATKFRGINLAPAGEEGACWDGYEQIGTKILDGREVPNCVPIK